MVPPENARRIHDRLDRASRRKLILFRGASHGMLFQDATRFVDEIIRFVRT